MNNENEILLDITTERKRERIKINDQYYELRAAGEFKLKEYMWLAEQGKRALTFQDGDMSIKRVGEMNMLIDKLMRKILVKQIPRRIYRKLAPMQKIAIIKSFTQVVLVVGETARPQAGTKFSPTSKGSMADLSKAGLTHDSE